MELRRLPISVCTVLHTTERSHLTQVLAKIMEPCVRTSVRTRANLSGVNRTFLYSFDKNTKNSKSKHKKLFPVSALGLGPFDDRRISCKGHSAQYKNALISTTLHSITVIPNADLETRPRHFITLENQHLIKKKAMDV